MVSLMVRLAWAAGLSTVYLLCRWWFGVMSSLGCQILLGFYSFTACVFECWCVLWVTGTSGEAAFLASGKTAV